MTNPTTAPPGAGGPVEIEPGAPPVQIDFLKRRLDLALQRKEQHIWLKAPEERRRQMVKEKLDRSDDPDVAVGRGLAKLLIGMQGDSLITLNNNETRILGLAETSTLTRANVQRMIEQRIQVFDGGAEDIFRPREVLAEEMEVVVRNRLAGESAYVSLQAVLLETTIHNSLTANDFGTVGHMILHNQAPLWAQEEILQAVEQLDLENEEQVLALEEVNALYYNASKNHPKLAEVIRKANEAAPAIRIRKEETAKKNLHAERIARLEEDTYNAAEKIGYQSVKPEESGLPQTDITVKLEELKANNVYTLPMRTILSDKILKEAIGDRLNFTNSTMARLEVLAIIMTDSDIRNSVVNTIVAANVRDWTGYDSNDYRKFAKEEECRRNWEATLRRLATGYAVGVLEAASALEPQYLEFAEEVASDALALMFGSGDINHPANEFQIRAAKMIAWFGESLDKARKEAQADRLANFFTRLEPTDESIPPSERARRKAEERRKRAEQATEDRAAKARELLGKVTDANTQLTQAVVGIEAFRDGELYIANRAMIEALSFQGLFDGIRNRFPLNKVVIIDKKDGVSVRDELLNRILAQCSDAEGALRLEVEKGDKADKKTIQQLRFQVEARRADRNFVVALQKRLGELWKTKVDVAGHLGFGTYETHYYSSDLRTPEVAFGGNSGKIRQDMPQKVAEIFDTKTGRLAVLRQKIGGFSQELAKAPDDSSVDREALLTNIREAQREAQNILADAKYLAQEMNPTNNLTIANSYRYAAQVYISALLKPELEGKGLIALH